MELDQTVRRKTLRLIKWYAYTPAINIPQGGVMGKINYGRVILGGVIGGIVAGFLDWFLNGVLMGQLWADAMNSLNRPNAFSATFLVCLFLVYSIGGILMIWMYAAMRPRFGG